MEDVFKLVGKIAIENAEANKNIDDTTKKAETASKKLSKSFESIGKGLKTAGTKITSVGKTMTATLTTGFTALVASGIKYNATMQDLEANLTTLLGSSDKAKALLNDLKEMAATTPYETTDLINATQTMIGFGISANDAQKYLGILGDISMGNSEKLSGLSLAFAQVQSTGKLTGQDLNQMINQGFNPLLYISKMTGKSMATLKDEMSKGAISAEMVADAFEYATQKGQPFYKSMDKSSQTINGRISTLKDNVNMLVGSLTESLLPTFERLVDKAIQLMEKFQNLSQEQKDQILKWGAIAAAIGPVLIVVGKVTTAIGGLFEALSKIASMSGVSSAIDGFVAACGGASAALGVVAIAIVAVVSVVVFLKEHWDKVVETFKNFAQNTGLAEKFEEIKSKIEPLVEKLKGLKDLFEVIGGFIVASLVPTIAILAGLFNGFVSMLSPLMDALGGLLDILGGIGTFIKSVFVGDWQGAWDAIKQIVSGFETFFKGIFQAIWEYIKGFVDGIVGFFKGLFDAIGLADFLNKVKSTLSDWWNNIVSWLSNAWNLIVDVVKVGFELIRRIVVFAFELITIPFRFIWENCKEYIIGAWNAIKETVSNKINEIKSVIEIVQTAIKVAVTIAWGYIKEKIITPITEAYNSVKEKVNAIKEAVSSKFNEVKSKTQEAWNSIKEKISTPINNAKTTVSNTVNSIKSSVSNAFNSVRSTVSSTWNSIKTAIETPINNAKTTVQNAINAIKGAFNFSWSLPHLNLPHISVNGGEAPYGIGGKGSLPTFNIDWYKKAMNNPIIMNEPTAFGISPNGNLRVGGEAGSEVVSGTNTLMNMISSAVAAQNNGLVDRLNAVVSVLSEYLPQLANMQLVTDTGVLVGEIAPQMDEELGKIKDRRERGR